MSLILRLYDSGFRSITVEQSENGRELRLMHCSWWTLPEAVIAHLERADKFERKADNPRFNMTPALLRGVMQALCSKPSMALANHTRDTFINYMEWLLSYVLIVPNDLNTNTLLAFVTDIDGQHEPIALQSFRIKRVVRLLESPAA